MGTTTFFAQLVSVHVTLLLALTRWMAVTYPLHVRTLLAPRRVYGACWVLFTWSFVQCAFSKIASYRYTVRLKLCAVCLLQDSQLQVYRSSEALCSVPSPR